VENEKPFSIINYQFSIGYCGFGVGVMSERKLSGNNSLLEFGTQCVPNLAHYQFTTQCVLNWRQSFEMAQLQQQELRDE
jgi:hypothetical protein